MVNARGIHLRTWLEGRHLTVLNSSLTYGIPTYLTSASGNRSLCSIIDLFITNDTPLLRSPSMKVFSDLSQGSDHRLLSLSFNLVVSDPPVLDASARPTNP
ncbi:MAG: hypothetical protein EXX96DRAFT_538152 [Benjaminiella poitrasii]|nr:MAG: hypothetical protein EXX96DRAFT_538152 [Benjaminiella poitrasii]